MLRITRTALVGILISVALIVGCGEKQLTIPITTKSDEAREAYIKGREYAENLRRTEARAYFEQAIEADPDFALAYFELANTQNTVHEFFSALNEATARVNLVSAGERLLIESAEAGNAGATTLQKQLLESLVDLYPRDKRAHMALGNFFFGQQLYQQSITEYRKIKTLDPDFAPPYNMAGYAFRFLNKYKEAEEALKTYIRLIPNDPNPYDSYAELLLKMGEFDESIESYRRALEIDSAFTASYMGIASNLVHLDKHNAARLELQVMYDHAPDNGVRRNALFMKGLTWADQGKLDQTLEEFYLMLAISEELGDSGTVANDMQLIGRIHLEMGNWDATRGAMERLLNATAHANLPETIKNNSRRTYRFGLAVIAVESGDLTLADQLAQEYWQEIEEVGTRFQIMNAHALYGRIAAARKDWPKAVKEFEQSNHQNPNNLYRLALAYKGNNSLVQAKKIAKEVAEFNQTLTINYCLTRHQATELYQSL